MLGVAVPSFQCDTCTYLGMHSFERTKRVTVRQNSESTCVPVRQTLLVPRQRSTPRPFDRRLCFVVLGLMGGLTAPVLLTST